MSKTYSSHPHHQCDDHGHQTPVLLLLEHGDKPLHPVDGLDLRFDRLLLLLLVRGTILRWLAVVEMGHRKAKNAVSPAELFESGSRLCRNLVLVLVHEVFEVTRIQREEIQLLPLAPG